MLIRITKWYGDRHSRTGRSAKADRPTEKMGKTPTEKMDTVDAATDTAFDLFIKIGFDTQRAQKKLLPQADKTMKQIQKQMTRPLTAISMANMPRMATALGLALSLGACDVPFVPLVQNQPVPGHSAGNTGSENEAFLTLARRMASQGNHAAAIPLFRQAMKRAPISSAPRVGLGESLMALGRYDEAIYSLSGALNADSRNPQALTALGTSYLVLNRPEIAIEKFRAAESNGGWDATLYSGLAVAYDLVGNHAAALSAFERGLTKYPDDMELIGNMGLSMALAGDAHEGAALLEDVVKQPSASAAHRQNLALAYVMAGNTQKAVRMASIDLDPSMARQTVAEFTTLAAMNHQNRVHTLLYGQTNPDHDLEQVANRDLKTEGTHDAVRIAAAERVIGVPALPEPEPMPEPTPEPVVELPPLMDSVGWAVQIAAYRKAEEVMAGWHELHEKYKDVIGHLDPRRSEVNFGEHDGPGPRGFYYRLNAGPLKDFNAAREVCDKLHGLGGSCWIRPPERSEGRLPKK